MVTAMKTEFLPPKHDFKLLTNISNRRQKSSETFAEYLNMMQSLFKHLSIPISAEQKLCIIEENMLPKYAIATSVLDIGTLDQLAKVCRRVDYAYTRSPAAVPYERTTDHRQNFRPGQYPNRTRALHLVETSHQSPNAASNFPGLEIGAEEDAFENQKPEDDHQMEAGEILEMRRGANNFPFNDPQPARECYNCRKVGHSFNVCPLARGKFCYR